MCAHWVAYNDHAPGAGTHANTTRYDVFGNVAGSNGPLKNIITGATLGANLTVSRAASGVAGAQAAANPDAGTLLYAAFNGFVDFAGSPSNSVELSGSGIVTYTFTGLDPLLRYSLRGSAVRGDPAYANRWTLCEITGAASFSTAHSSTRVLTSASVPALTAGQAALNTGINHTEGTGDYVGWDDIEPAANGSFSITSRQYTGTVPSGSAAGSKGYGLTGLRLEESPCPSPQTLSILTEPRTQAVIEGWTAAFDVGVVGCPAYYQWFKDGNAVPGATSRTLRFAPAFTNNAGSYCAVITNQLGSVTSSVVTLIVFPDLSARIVPLTNAWRYNQSGANLGSAWKEVSYNDSTWPTGRAVLAAEENPAVTPLTNTVLSLTGLGGQAVITYYFRTHFTITNTKVTLLFSNLVDDGAVVWLNGTELFRCNMGSGVVSSSTLASNATEGVFSQVTLVPPNLVAGDNVLAVEVHQAETSSSDVVFGMSVTEVPLASGPVVVRSAPQTRHVTRGADVLFEVAATGQAPLTYQWRCNGVELPGETNASLGLHGVSIERDGFYSVSISNPFGVTRTTPVRLTINPLGLVPFYANGFEEAVGSEWSSSTTELTPNGSRRFLGQFGPQTVTLALWPLPPHAAVAVTFDLLLIKSWDGNATGFIGPDQWKLDVMGGPELVNSTFSNWRTVPVRAAQFFPDPFGGAIDNPPLTGADEENTLGYASMDSVYRITRSCDHSADSLVLHFSAANLQPLSDESWGLDNVRVYLLDAPPLRFALLPEESGQFKLRLGGLDHHGTVVLDTSTSLLPGSWVPVLTNATGTLEFSQSATNANRFFRARTQ